MLLKIKHLLELIRFSHTVFALPFALLAAILAWHSRREPFAGRELAGILLCMVFARSAAMAFNRLVDWKFDAANPRTAGRHLPAGLLSGTTVILFTIACSAGFIASTGLFLPNPWPIWLAVPVLLFLLGYSYAKRFTAWCHYWLSAALMLSPLAAWIAIRAEVAWTPVCLAAVVFFWVGGFDILYACQDADFDQAHQLRSIPVRWGIGRALKLAAVSHLLTAVCLFAFWRVAGFGAVFLSGIIAVTLLLAYEHWLVRPDDLSRVGVAFFNINAVIGVGLLLLGVADLYVRHG
ncbi:MAG TPA: UbiA-like polyprenyltransferase [Planctomycetaceae bacterium]|nr:UbiA-like polyprenyltransferase [Planctomycetaceae bacterium]